MAFHEHITENLNWQQTGGKLCDFDDGHIPESFYNSITNKNCTNNATTTKLVDYPDLFQRPPQVRIYSAACDESLVDAIYQKTVESAYPAWGDYATISQVQDYWKTQKDASHKASKDCSSLLVQLVARYLELATETEFNDDAHHTKCTTIGSRGTLFSKHDLQRAHGVAVWGLRAKAGSEVNYHLDYAEQIRYSSNIIVPPLLAGTLHCTRDQLEGGDFQVSLEGIAHYHRHGYKAKKLNVQHGNNDMIRIPYCFNQMICHLGNLPHSSTKIDCIHGTQDRVIVGFNVFCHEAGPLVQRAPEHSDQFRRSIQLQRWYLHNQNHPLSLLSLKENKSLSKLLVLAKRERVKSDYKRSLERLAIEVPTKLPDTVAALMAFFSHETEFKIVSDDVRVFLHHEIQHGRLKVVNGYSHSTDGLVPVTAELDVA